MSAITWNEGIIARHISTQTLSKRCVVLVDNCNWTGHECDVLGVTTDLRIIDIEVKISRGDFKADARKDKWWHRFGSVYGGQDASGRPIYRQPESVHRDWPPKVWKHYFAMPADVWTDALFEFMPSPKSGLILLRERKSGTIEAYCHRRSTPNKNATKITAAHAVDIARLANLRMWESYGQLEVAKRDAAYWRGKAKEAA